MADVTNEPMYEVLKQIQASIGFVREDMHDLKQRMTSMEHIEASLARVEKRLEPQ